MTMTTKTTTTTRRIAAIVGTRPEAIKMAPVVRALRRRADVETIVISTGQHREMLDQILGPFDVRVDHELALMEPNQSLFRLTSKAVDAFERALESLAPSFLLVQGDTTTAFVAALCAFYAKVPVGHVEAGLRTDDRYAPFPEEINRRLVSQLASLHFAPTEQNRARLLAEGAPAASVFVTGNTVVDALFDAVELDVAAPAVPAGKRVVLVTAHRRESFGAPLEAMFGALAELARAYDDVHIVYPVHLNPNVQAPARAILGDVPNVTLCAPLGYFEFVKLMAKSRLILTDSGGIQEEAPSLGVPVLVLRNETERTEAIAAGTVRLVGTDRAKIVAEARRLLDDERAWQEMSRAVNPYGDGRAAERIVTHVLDYLARSSAPAR
jgi:UDP-N-acetylglucosamine 2-epimerase (non-hydrolysing)